MSPLPGTRVIGPDWSQHHRRAAAGGMNATCEVRGPSTGSVYDPDTMVTTATPGPLVWTGACRVQALVGDAKSSDQAGQEVTVRGYLVQLDETGTPVPVLEPHQHTVKILTAANDALLVGHVLSIRDVQYGSERFTRDLICDDNEQ